ncbi:hypothetical protein L1987_36195 [Smallanthus sonchifolius]|uniref:Uncharacterized protein n=1 Tax=Smallanthus sonchifolius TaxID=185202 RepID=A0ACB9HCW8_9ASTR|nr:hypothetical protein L1987_36195 [Smallanthus sonchifolius]
MMRLKHSFYVVAIHPCFGKFLTSPHLFFNPSSTFAASFHSNNWNCKQIRGLKTLKDAVSKFNHMAYRKPIPPIPEFTKAPERGSKRITAWESLQSAKAEAVIRKLEMKL